MPSLSRRTLLKGSALIGAYGLGLAAANRFAEAGVAAAPLEIEAKTTTAILDGRNTTKNVFTYSLPGESSPMPPVLRLKRNAPFAARLINRLDDATTIHWHGLRIPNAMDGVPFLTQPYVYKGDHFDYAFTPPDAGTFWYHPHCSTLEQMGHGMTGLLIVEDPKDPVFDAELTLNLRDWRLGSDGQFIELFKPRDTARAGTFGTVRGANWQVEPRMQAPTGGLVRLRLAATDVTRIYNLKLDGAEAMVLALDGQPLAKPKPLDMAVVAPGQRLDLAIRMPDSEGQEASLVDLRPSTPKVVARFQAAGASLKRTLSDTPALQPNPFEEPDLGSAEHIPLVLSSTAENAARDSICGTLGYSFWAINKVVWPGDTPDPMAPLAELKQGRSYVFDLVNTTPHAHPIHLHGMNFKVVASSKGPVDPLISDTYLVLPDEKVQLALVAHNPGDWVLHCHIIEHQKTGMTSYIRVV
ncbi:multicopper oxidase family protein [Rhizobium paknamense]|uniref:FtsP/CotA-like multicopper oxidase with cupredoxin domain n=1 Tax=Rhizobium paknamense TaxID=1206817 RepID=A0ABU0IA02_9HYPH|nr:multicopper oxidase family protein [Rhizobium paknamense]MDQ0454101.1 FtsP/CotA-like multicopper oxidase with cupredoxin domain [Rhizobium paknamense]